MDSSLPGSSVHGISYGQQEYWSGYIAISFSRGASQPRDQTQVTYIAGRLFIVGATLAFFKLKKREMNMHIHTYLLVL